MSKNTGIFTLVIIGVSYVVGLGASIYNKYDAHKFKKSLDGVFDSVQCDAQKKKEASK